MDHLRVWDAYVLDGERSVRFQRHIDNSLSPGFGPS